jgi:hypothetical protein
LTEFFREEVILERRKGMSFTFISAKWEAKNTYLVMLARRPSGGPGPILRTLSLASASCHIPASP